MYERLELEIAKVGLMLPSKPCRFLSMYAVWRAKRLFGSVVIIVFQNVFLFENVLK